MSANSVGAVCIHVTVMASYLAFIDIYNIKKSRQPGVDASAISDLQYERYMKILSKLLEHFDECSWKEFSNIPSCSSP